MPAHGTAAAASGDNTRTSCDNIRSEQACHASLFKTWSRATVRCTDNGLFSERMSVTNRIPSTDYSVPFLVLCMDVCHCSKFFFPTFCKVSENLEQEFPSSTYKYTVPVYIEESKYSLSSAPLGHIWYNKLNSTQDQKI